VESSGHPGKIKISGSTYELIRDYSECEYRGRVNAKNKGEIDMYFVLRLKQEFSEDEEGKFLGSFVSYLSIKGFGRGFAWLKKNGQVENSAIFGCG
jgi:hypothetical protein